MSGAAGRGEGAPGAGPEPPQGSVVRLWAQQAPRSCPGHASGCCSLRRQERILASDELTVRGADPRGPSGSPSHAPRLHRTISPLPCSLHPVNLILTRPPESLHDDQHSRSSWSSLPPPVLPGCSGIRDPTPHMQQGAPFLLRACCVSREHRRALCSRDCRVSCTY